MNKIVVLTILLLGIFQSGLIESDKHEYLDIKDCLITYQKDDTFVYCLANNLNITDLTRLVGFNVTVKYSSLTISKKQLRNLSEPIFVNYTIKQLNLLQNQIVYFTNETFRYINDLQVLKLDNNLIGEDSFRSLLFSASFYVSLKCKLSANSIGKLSKILPASFSNMTELYLMSNKINYLCDGVFENLKNLKILDLSSNALAELTPRVFVNLTSLLLINLNSNNLKSIESFTFADLPNLLHLYLNDNQLGRMNALTFGLNDTKLAHFEMKYNRFDQVPEAIAKSAKSLSILQLAGNRMSLFNFGSIANMSNMTTFNLAMCKIDRLIYGDLNRKFSLVALKKLLLTFSNLNQFDFSFVIDYLTSLNELSLSYNQLKSITYSRMWKLHQNLNSLNLDNNLISELTPNNFQPFYGLIYLNLQQNLIITLPSQAFKGLVALRNLDLSQNQIVSVASYAFSELTQLKTLNLSNNRIRFIETGSLYAMVSLKILDLTWNKLESVKRADFQPVQSLEDLYLSNNFIISIEPYSFENLINLKTLWLDWNYLTTVEDFSFARLKNLDYLSLYSNYIQTVEAFSFARSTIDQLDLGSNYIISFEFLANIADFVKVVSLTDNEYTSFMVKRFPHDSFSSNLEKLDLSFNKIKEFRFESELFGLIQSLDLSWNLIESIRIDDFRSLVNLKNLNLSNNRLKHVEKGFFEFFKINTLILNNSFSDVFLEINYLGSNLTEIDLSFNYLGQTILEDANHTLQKFDGNSLKVLRLVNVHFQLSQDWINLDKCAQLTTLDLSYNTLKLDLNLLNLLPNLERLYLKSTGLESLNDVKFVLNNLDELNLAQNYISAVPRSFFRFLNGLRVIDLSYNLIEFIDETLLDDISYLGQLNLEHNRISGSFILPFTRYCKVINLNSNNLSQFIRPVDMEQLNDLKRLDLSNNQLGTVDFGSFFDSEKAALDLLLLNDNLIDNIPAYSFNEMVKLTRLVLRANRLRTLDEETFAYLVTLEWLDLSRNQLTFDENITIFDNLVRLKHLNLSCNQIEYVNQRLFAHLFNLNELDLSSNQLKGIESYSLSSLGQLTYLDVSNNSDLTLDQNSLFGLDSIKDVWISFDQLADNLVNQQILAKSFKLTSPRHVGEVTYYRSVYINYRELNMDCSLVLKFIKQSIQLKLRSEDDYSLFINKCYYFVFF